MIIHKYKLDKTKIGKWQQLSLSFTYTILKADFQDGEIYLWCLVNDECQLKETRTFTVLFTGDKVNDYLKLKHIATMQYNDYIYHLFEKLDD